MRPVAIVVVALLTTSATRAVAQQPDQAALDAAAAEYQKGVELYTHEEYLEAALHFRKAQETAAAPANLYNMAKCYEKLSRYGDAIEYYQRYISEYRDKKKKDPPDLGDVESTIRDLQQRQFESFPEVSVNSSPAGANLYLGSKDKVLGQTPFRTHLEPGEYVLFLDKEGYEPFETRFEVRGTTPSTLNFQMAEIKNVGYVTVRVNVIGAEIIVDGRLHGLSPFPDQIQVNAGRHQVIVKKERYSRMEKAVEIASGQTVSVDATLFLTDVPYSWRGYLGWTSIALGLGGVATGVVFYTLADKEFAGSDKFKEYELYQNLGYICGGSLMGIGTALVIWEHTRDAVGSGDEAFIAPLPGGAAAMWGGTF